MIIKDINHEIIRWMRCITIFQTKQKMNSIKFMILIIFINLVKSELGLIWSDEFNGNELDYNNWHVRGNDDICESKF